MISKSRRNSLKFLRHICTRLGHDFLLLLFGGLECVGHSFAYVVHFLFLRDVWIRTQRGAVASRRANNLAIHLPNLATRHPQN
jgi:hypothetical protein